MDRKTRNAYHRRYRKRNPEQARAAQARYNAKHPLRHRASMLKLRYGLTEGGFDTLLAAQDGKCAICRKTPEQTKRGIFDVDHDHATTIVRGLLCQRCNIALALLDESVETTLALVAYLLKHKGDGP